MTIFILPPVAGHPAPPGQSSQGAGGCRRMSKDAALQNARRLKAAALGIPTGP